MFLEPISYLINPVFCCIDPSITSSSASINWVVANSLCAGLSALQLFLSCLHSPHCCQSDPSKTQVWLCHYLIQFLGTSSLHSPVLTLQCHQQSLLLVELPAYLSSLIIHHNLAFYPHALHCACSFPWCLFFPLPRMPALLPLLSSPPILPA